MFDRRIEIATGIGGFFMNIEDMSDSDLVTELNNRINSGSIKVLKEEMIFGIELIYVISLKADKNKIQLAVV